MNAIWSNKIKYLLSLSQKSTNLIFSKTSLDKTQCDYLGQQEWRDESSLKKSERHDYNVKGYSLKA